MKNEKFKKINKKRRIKRLHTHTHIHAQENVHQVKKMNESRICIWNGMHASAIVDPSSLQIAFIIFFFLHQMKIDM